MLENTENYVLGQLDYKTRLVAAPQCFILKESTVTKDGKIVWKSKFFYGELGDAIHGYVRHLFRDHATTKSLTGSVQLLINAINKLENTIHDTGLKLMDDWDERMRDPVEYFLVNRGESS